MSEESYKVPQHIAIIMDGNGRWAHSRSKSRNSGHRAGVKAVRSIVEAASERGVGVLTLFAFSSENWSRPHEEVSSLMKLFFEALQREVKDLHQNNVKVSFIGERDRLQPRLVEQIKAAEDKTADNDGLHLIIAVAYGGRWDLINATRRLAENVAAGELAADDINEEIFASQLQLGGVSDPDLLIRTGGEQRISNFLLWNIAYAELYFSDKLWPDFTVDDLDASIDYFNSRERRFGHTGDQVGIA